MEALSFLPKQKIDKVKKKIAGVNPVLILKQELSESTHASKKYYKQLCETIQGPTGSQRNTLLSQKKTFLDVEEQVDCLIETARDPDILGRVWLGWSAYI
jgi:DNA-dependent protein kinase catalytic subunit